MGSRLEDLGVYKFSEGFADEVWFIVVGWEYFERSTIGKQLVRSADSIRSTIFTLFSRSEERVIERLSDDRVSTNEGTLRECTGDDSPRLRCA